MPAFFRKGFIALFTSFLSCPIHLHADFNHLGFGFDNNKKSVTIPFKSVKNLIILESVIDGKNKLNLILDTGVRSLIIFDKSYIPKVSDNTFEIKFNSAGLGKPIEATVSTNHNLRLCDDVTANSINTVILERSNRYLHKLKGVKIHGAFGYQLFARFQVIIDYDNHLITLREPYKRNKINGFEAIPISIYDTKPFVEVKFLSQNNDWHKMNLILDLGANHHLLVFDPTKVKRSYDPFRSMDHRIAEGLSGPIYGKKGLCESIKLGTLNYSNVEILVPTKRTYHRESIDEIEKHGSIGSRFFRDSVIVIDYINGYLFVEKSNANVSVDHYLVENMRP
ncbi:MAG: retropepsin-like domain-containing protein [Cytophagales bacterium]|nr:retropepsin-like domain-containing protein [Cytophagales bacterium]